MAHQLFNYFLVELKMSEVVQFNQTEVSFIRNIIDTIKDRGFGYHKIPFMEKEKSAITIKVFLPGHKYIGHYNVFASNADNANNVTFGKHDFGIDNDELVESKKTMNSVIEEVVNKAA